MDMYITNKSLNSDGLTIEMIANIKYIPRIGEYIRLVPD